MFVDTNVLVGARFSSSPHHEAARVSLAQAKANSEPIRISRQIVREYLVTVTRPQDWTRPLPLDMVLRDIEWLHSTFEILEDGKHVADLLVALFREFCFAGKQIHDANIAATMLANGEQRLLTFNAKDFSRFSERIELVAIETAE